ncbi:hypothetical protein JOB18_002700 [Solea senegalensis]|uniref:Uncharacterized protein n=1 Tax=Solea senegalensis TaxID=28829 RepID=A0AAV6RRW5_SOLSE|nr:hypothetical protein JOB18_002700 [Solea senegalensis]
MTRNHTKRLTTRNWLDATTFTNKRGGGQFPLSTEWSFKPSLVVRGLDRLLGTAPFNERGERIAPANPYVG